MIVRVGERRRQRLARPGRRDPPAQSPATGSRSSSSATAVRCGPSWSSATAATGVDTPFGYLGLNVVGPGGTRDHVPVTSSDGLADLDRELLNAVQWDFPLEPRPYAALGERLGISEADTRARSRTSRSSACCASSPRSSTPGPRLRLVARRRPGRPRSGRRGRRGDQRAPGREPQLQAQPPRTTSGTRSRSRPATRSRSTSTCCTATRARSSRGACRR